MNNQAIIFITLLLSVGVTIYLIDRRHRFAPFSLRRSHEKLWRKAISENDFEKVDALLSELMRIFLLPVGWRYRLKPSDDLHCIMDRHTDWGPYGYEDYDLVQFGRNRFGVDFTPLFMRKPCRIRDLVDALTDVKT
jgi:hypothetical protein